MATDKLIISYSGSLACFDPAFPYTNKLFTFRNYSINNPDTRSAYFIFNGLKCFIEKYPEMKDRVELHLWGLIDTANKIQAEKMGINSLVKISGYLTKQESLEKLLNTDLLFLPLERGVNSHEPYALPGKMFEYFKSEKPILALCTESECSRLLLKSGLGIICNPMDAENMADKIKFLIENKNELNKLYKADLDFIKNNFSPQILTKQLADIFKKELE